MTNRLDDVLVRNRKHRVIDLLGAAFLLFVMAFSGATMAAELSALAPRATEPAPEAVTLVAQESASSDVARVAYR